MQDKERVQFCKRPSQPVELPLKREEVLEEVINGLSVKRPFSGIGSKRYRAPDIVPSPGTKVKFIYDVSVCLHSCFLYNIQC